MLWLHEVCIHMIGIKKRFGSFKGWGRDKERVQWTQPRKTHACTGLHRAGTGRALVPGPGAAQGILPSPSPGPRRWHKQAGTDTLRCSPQGSTKPSCSPRKGWGQGLLSACLQLLHRGSQGTWPLCAQCSTQKQPHTGNGVFCSRHHPGLELFPHLHDSSTSHMEETQGEGWIRQEKWSLNSLEVILGPKQNTAGPGDPPGWLGWPHHNWGIQGYPLQQRTPSNSSVCQ